jgi:hypothetical protein
MRARYYHERLRRFINRDTLLGEIGDFGSLNRFAYVNGLVSSGVDPTGHCLEDGCVLEITTLSIAIQRAMPVIQKTANKAMQTVAVGYALCQDELISVYNKTAIEIAKVRAKVNKNLNNIRKSSSGFYVITFDNGYIYVGKGKYKRYVQSMKVKEKTYNVNVNGFKTWWLPAFNDKSAFIAEQVLLKYYVDYKGYEFRGEAKNGFSEYKVLNKINQPGQKWVGSVKGK